MKISEKVRHHRLDNITDKQITGSTVLLLCGSSCLHDCSKWNQVLNYLINF